MQSSKAALAFALLASTVLGCAKDSLTRVSNVFASGIPVRPLSSDGAGSTLALAEVGKRRIAFAADEDDRRVHAFDLDRRVELSVTPLDGRPAQLVIARDGSLFVAMRDRSVVARYRIADEDGALDFVRDLPASTEPIGLALAEGERTLLVASGWGAKLDVIDTVRNAIRTRIPLSREPRAVVALPDGRAFVAHAVDQPLTVVNFADPTPEARPYRVPSLTRTGGQGFALASVDGKVFAPQVLADPDLGATYYGGPTMTPFVVMVGEEAAPPPSPSATGTLLPTDNMGRPIRPVAMPAFRSISSRLAPPMIHCLLPRAAAVRRTPEPRLLVACLGDDALVEYLTLPPTPQSLAMKKRSLPGGVTGLAVDTKRDTAVAWAQYTRQLVFVELVDGPTNAEQDTKAIATVAASGVGGLDAELQLGRRIFHAASDSRLSADGRACASCHPDGRDDGRVWRTPEGPRQTIMLAGRLADTAPYGWQRQKATLVEYFSDTISRLQGRGLPLPEAVALEKYLLSLSAPSEARKHSDLLVSEGKAIFESKEAACASCHRGTATTDGLRHDVGSHGELETPSLRFVGKSAPYFHDGRYGSLRALLMADDTNMGSTRHLAPNQIDALAAYLESL